MTEELSSLKFPQHVQLVCFGSDTLSCVYIWVKIRSVSVGLVETHRHLQDFAVPAFHTCGGEIFVQGERLSESKGRTPWNSAYK